MTTVTSSSSPQISGALVIDKPVNKTSRDTVTAVSQMLGIKRIGHIGSLHEKASGVLVLLIGPAVKLSQYLNEPSKKYQVVITLSNAGNVTEAMVIETLQSEVGEHEIQAHSHRPQQLTQRPKDVMVTNIELLEFGKAHAAESNFDIVVDIHCSAGTYLMQFVSNLSKKLQCDTYLAGTRRTKSGKFTLKEAVTLKQLQEAISKNSWSQLVRPAAEVIEQMPAVTLPYEKIELIKKGMLVAATDEEIQLHKSMIVYAKKPSANTADYIFRLINDQGELIALICIQQGFAEHADQIIWRPIKNFQSEN